MLVRTVTRHSTRVLLIVAAALLAGCSASHYRRSADKEVYGIIDQAEVGLFGTNSHFSIQPGLSNRPISSVSSFDVLDDRKSTNRRVLNLSQALELAAQNSREYRTQKENLYLAALNLTGARYALRPHFFAGSGVTTEGVGGFGQTGWSVENSLGVSQLFDTGGTLTASLFNDILSFYTGNRPREVQSVISMRVTQPLLRGFGANNGAVEQLTQSERGVVYQLRSFQRYQQQFAVDIVDDYFGLLTQKDVVRNNFRNYTNRVETTRYLDARAVDRERRSSVDDARTAELTARRGYIDSLASHLNALDRFKISLGIPVSDEVYLDDADLRQLIEAGLMPVEISSQAAFEMALQNQMDILNAVDAFEDSRRQVRIEANQLKSDLDFDGNLSVESDRRKGPEDFLNFDMDEVRYSLGVRLDLPIDRLRERNSYRRALIDFERSMRALSNTLDDYRDRVDRGIRSLEQARLNYLNGAEALRVAERRVDNTRLLLEAGRATLRDVREAQDSLISAQNNLSNLYASYLSFRLNLLLNMGALETRTERFWLQDPLRNILGPSQRSSPALRMPDDAVLPPEHFLEPS